MIWYQCILCEEVEYWRNYSMDKCYSNDPENGVDFSEISISYSKRNTETREKKQKLDIEMYCKGVVTGIEMYCKGVVTGIGRAKLFFC
jgi:hypothetical protein